MDGGRKEGRRAGYLLIERFLASTEKQCKEGDLKLVRRYVRSGGMQVSLKGRGGFKDGKDEFG